MKIAGAWSWMTLVSRCLRGRSGSWRGAPLPGANDRPARPRLLHDASQRRRGIMYAAIVLSETTYDDRNSTRRTARCDGSGLFEGWERVRNNRGWIDWR